MKIVLLTGLVLAATSTCWSYSRPCQHDIVLPDDQGFSRKHILQYDFNLSDQNAWERYLRIQRLWCRMPKQSFLPANRKTRVRQICSRSGVRVRSNLHGNLCSSRSQMQVYDVTFFGNCRMSVTRKTKFVIVGCSLVGRRCLPVHYEGNAAVTRTRQTCTSYN